MFQILNKTGDERVKWGWAVYDWANNVYSLVITTAIFPIFYITATTENTHGNVYNDCVKLFGFEFVNTELYSYVLALSFVAVIILSPLLSGMADFAGKKKLFMRIFCYMGSAGCIGLYWFDPNHLELSMIPFFLASLGFWGSVGFYNAYLPEIAPREEHDKLIGQAAWQKGDARPEGDCLGSCVGVVIIQLLTSQNQTFVHGSFLRIFF